jgi:trimethylamine monooxygenase
VSKRLTFSAPKISFHPGFESFKGRILQDHDFRDAMEFKDEDLLLIGTSYSAKDMGS